MEITQNDTEYKSNHLDKASFMSFVVKIRFQPQIPCVWSEDEGAIFIMKGKYSR